MAKLDRQLHVKLGSGDAASLKKIAKADSRTLSDSVRHLIRREAIARQALAEAHRAAACK